MKMARAGRIGWTARVGLILVLTHAAGGASSDGGGGGGGSGNSGSGGDSDGDSDSDSGRVTVVGGVDWDHAWFDMHDQDCAVVLCGACVATVAEWPSVQERDHQQPQQRYRTLATVPNAEHFVHHPNANEVSFGPPTENSNEPLHLRHMWIPGEFGSGPWSLSRLRGVKHLRSAKLHTTHHLPSHGWPLPPIPIRSRIKPAASFMFYQPCAHLILWGYNATLEARQLLTMHEPFEPQRNAQDAAASAAALAAYQRRKFAVYSSSRCIPHRDLFYDELKDAAERAAAGAGTASSAGGGGGGGEFEVEAIGSCHGRHADPRLSVDRIKRAQASYGDRWWVGLRGGSTFIEDSVEMMKGYKVCMAFENTNLSGYVTEKLPAAFFAGEQARGGRGG